MMVGLPTDCLANILQELGGGQVSELAGCALKAPSGLELLQA